MRKSHNGGISHIILGIFRNLANKSVGSKQLQEFSTKNIKITGILFIILLYQLPKDSAPPTEDEGRHSISRSISGRSRERREARLRARGVVAGEERGRIGTIEGGRRR
jgi:hypothetical protein